MFIIQLSELIALQNWYLSHFSWLRTWFVNSFQLTFFHTWYRAQLTVLIFPMALRPLYIALAHECGLELSSSKLKPMGPSISSPCHGLTGLITSPILVLSSLGNALLLRLYGLESIGPSMLPLFHELAHLTILLLGNTLSSTFSDIFAYLFIDRVVTTSISELRFIIDSSILWTGMTRWTSGFEVEAKVATADIILSGFHTFIFGFILSIKLVYDYMGVTKSV